MMRTPKENLIVIQENILENLFHWRAIHTEMSPAIAPHEPIRISYIIRASLIVSWTTLALHVNRIFRTKMAVWVVFCVLHVEKRETKDQIKPSWTYFMLVVHVSLKCLLLEPRRK